MEREFIAALEIVNKFIDLRIIFNDDRFSLLYRSCRLFLEASEKV
jgi:hypothetical protein